jgi:hypothetical protein
MKRLKYDSEGTLFTISLNKFSNIALKSFSGYLKVYTIPRPKVITKWKKTKTY